MLVKEIVVIAVLMLAIDFLYLSSIGGFFNKQIKQVQGSDLKMNYLGGIICYPLLILGLYYFIIKNRKNYKTKGKMILDAMILGWVIYGVYESTNYAILKNWNWQTVLVDGVWGGILFGITTYLYLLLV
jgi:uncharacterized membrane protein